MARCSLFAMVPLVMLCGCSGLSRQPDYQVVREVPPLAVPQSADARPIKPLFPIPAGPVPTEWPKKFQAPAPKPLVVTDAPGGNNGSSPSVPASEKPVLTQDGNGYPLISIGGDFDSVWDRLGQVLRRAGVKVSDRDQRTGIYYLSVDDETGKGVPYELRLTRGQSAFALTLQKNDEALAPRATTRALFEAIVSRWPEPEAQQ